MKNNTNENDINAQIYDEIYSAEKNEAVNFAECTLIQSLAGNPPKKILDVGIGTGRHAQILAENGYKITGIDLSKGMLSVLSNKNIDDLKIIHDDFLKYDFMAQDKFDLITFMWNTFNEIALTSDDAVKIIKKSINQLFEDGKILLNIENTQSNDSYFPSFTFDGKLDNGDEVQVIWENESYDKINHVSTSKELVTINGIPRKPALIKQKWWTINEIKRITENFDLSFRLLSIKENNELYIVISK